MDLMDDAMTQDDLLRSIESCLYGDCILCKMWKNDTTNDCKRELLYQAEKHIKRCTSKMIGN